MQVLALAVLFFNWERQRLLLFHHLVVHESVGVLAEHTVSAAAGHLEGVLPRLEGLRNYYFAWLLVITEAAELVQHFKIILKNRPARSSVDTSAAATASVCSQCVRASSCASSAQTTSGVSA